MEADDISVVLTRASELHASICDAIERASRSQLRGAAISAAENGSEDDEEAEAVGATEEARSLDGIREALEVLETQLESLQAVQQQQRIRKDAALAELEESRRILLQRLKRHAGSELEVVQEALAFAGEPVKKKVDDLPLPPYLHHHHHDDEDEESTMVAKSNAGNEAEDEAIPRQEHPAAEEPQEEEESRLVFLGGFLRRVCTAALTRFTVKGVLVLMSVIAFLSVSDFELTKARNRSRKSFPKPSSSLPHAEPESAPEGRKLIQEENGESMCPFPRHIITLDVWHGRG